MKKIMKMKQKLNDNSIKRTQRKKVIEIREYVN